MLVISVKLGSDVTAEITHNLTCEYFPHIAHYAPLHWLFRHILENVIIGFQQNQIVARFQVLQCFVKVCFSKLPPLTSVIKEPPDVDGALPLLLLELLTGVQEPLIRHVQGNRRAPLL